MASADSFSRHYEALTPAERTTLALEAMARGDEGDAQRLHDACPRKTYSEMDIEFSERMDLAYDTMAAACIDLRCLWGKLQVIEGVRAEVSHLVGLHEANASLAFMEGVACGEGRPQMDCFARPLRPLPRIDLDDDEADGDVMVDGERPERDDEGAGDEDEAVAAASEAAAAGEDHAPPRRPDFAERMAAVEDRSERHSDVIDLVLRRATLDLARQWADAWAAFDRFCRTRLGVGPLTLLRAWAFPVAGDFEAAVRRYAHFQPDEVSVRKYLACLCRQWDRRFDPEKASTDDEADVEDEDDDGD